ncbi:Ycf66 protein N-terminus [Synechococcus sp. PCC 6312]|nr:Ycf66 protein N-terminus [Synechococcus sp. PCC 6312]
MFYPVLGQIVNVGLGPAGILGIGLAVGGAVLYFLRSVRPELARDHDIFFAAVCLLCGGILFFQGWRLDPILFFGQVLLTGSAVFFAIESIRLRRIATEQARRNTPVVDEDRPVSRTYTYRAELEELEPYEEDLPPVRRIRGSRDASRERYDDAWEDDVTPAGRLPSRRGNAPEPPERPIRPERPPTNPRPTRPTNRRPSRPTVEDDSPVDNYGEPQAPSRYEDAPPPRPRPAASRPSSTPDTSEPRSRKVGPRRRPRPRPELNDDQPIDTDYQPLDRPSYSTDSGDVDNSGNFDR